VRFFRILRFRVTLLALHKIYSCLFVVSMYHLWKIMRLCRILAVIDVTEASNRAMYRSCGLPHCSCEQNNEARIGSCLEEAVKCLVLAGALPGLLRVVVKLEWLKRAKTLVLVRSR
jgi:hypothetical protein